MRGRPGLGRTRRCQCLRRLQFFRFHRQCIRIDAHLVTQQVERALACRLNVGFIPVARHQGAVVETLFLGQDGVGPLPFQLQFPFLFLLRRQGRRNFPPHQAAAVELAHGAVGTFGNWPVGGQGTATGILANVNLGAGGERQDEAECRQNALRTP